MRAVTKRLRRGVAAAAEREPLRIGRLVLVAIPIDQLHIVAFNKLRTVLSDFDGGRHRVSVQVSTSTQPLRIPFFALRTGPPRCSSSCPSYPAATPSLRRATAD